MGREGMFQGLGDIFDGTGVFSQRRERLKEDEKQGVCLRIWDVCCLNFNASTLSPKQAEVSDRA